MIREIACMRAFVSQRPKDFALFVLSGDHKKINDAVLAFVRQHRHEYECFKKDFHLDSIISSFEGSLL